jgi:dolichol-phosphate mannosyltransferase
MRIFVVLPAYNEEDNLPQLLEGFARLAQSGALSRETSLKIVVVDDGSTDGTVPAAEAFSKRLDLVIEKHPKNLGLAETLRDGLKKVISVKNEQGSNSPVDDVVVTMDADNTQTPDLIPQLVGKIREGCDVAVASRYAKGAKEIGVSWFRRIVSHSAGLSLRFLFPTQGLRDYTCGYRAIRLSVLERLAQKTGGAFFFEEQGFACAVELLLNFRGLGAQCAEIPLVLRYDLKKGASKMKIPETVLGSLRLIWRLKTRDPF